MINFLKNKAYFIISTFSLLLALAALVLVNSKDKIINWLPQLSLHIHWAYFFFFIFFTLTATSLVWFDQKIHWKPVTARAFLAYLPTALILYYELSHYFKLNYFLYIFTVLYFLSAGIFLLVLLPDYWTSITKDNHLSSSQEKPNLKKNFFSTFIVVLIIGLNLFFSAYQVEKFAAVDEPLWLFKRIPDYWEGLKYDKWEKTFVSDKPGVTVSLLSGVGLHWVNPHLYDPTSWNGKFYPGTKNDFETLYHYLRLPIVIFASLSLFIFYFFLKDLLGKTAALLSLIFLSLSPILIGIERIINPDSLLWVFVPLSILAMINYFPNRQKKFIYSSGIFLGLALLTKYVANILFVFFLALIFLEYILNKEKYTTFSFNKYLKNSLYDYFILGFISLLVFTALCPAVWIKPGILFLATIHSQAFQPIWHLFALLMAFILLDTFIFKSFFISPLVNFIEKYKKFISWGIIGVILFGIIFTFLDVYTQMKPINFEEVLASPKSFYKNDWKVFPIQIFLTSFYPLVFGISPIVLLIIFSGLLYFIFSSKRPQNHEIVIYLLFFILLYYAGSAFSQVSSTIRYQIIIYPLVLILGGYFLKIIFDLISPLKKIPVLVLSLILILTGLYPLIRISPLYSGYASVLLPPEYFIDIKDMGAGSYEAAQFLNSLPNARELNIWTDKNGVCYFFQGNCYSGFIIPNQIDWDYLVLSSGRESRTGKISKKQKKFLPDLDKGYSQEKNLAFKLNIDGRPNQFIKIVPAKK